MYMISICMYVFMYVCRYIKFGFYIPICTYIKLHEMKLYIDI